jgi:hypothetical protein
MRCTPQRQTRCFVLSSILQSSLLLLLLLRLPHRLSQFKSSMQLPKGQRLMREAS